MDTVRADYFQVLLDVGRRGAPCDVGAGAKWRPTPSLCGFRRFCMKIDFRFRNLGQCAVRVLFFLERGIE